MPERPFAFLRSTTLRFILLTFACQLLLAGGVLLYAARSSEAALARQQEEALFELRDNLLGGFGAGGERELARQIAIELQTVQAESVVLLLVRPDGSVAAGNLDAWPALVPKAQGWHIVNLYRTGATRPEPMGIISTRLADGSHLLTGHVLSGRLEMLAFYRKAVLWIFLLAMLPALLLAMLLGRMIDRRIAAIAATADAVGQGILSHRVPLDGSSDSFDRLGASLNRMLERIEGLVGELRVVTDGLAHDLRSPITRLKSRIEQASAEVSDPVSLAALDSVGQEADLLLAMLGTALQISRAEASVGTENFAACDVTALLDDLAELYGPFAEDTGMTITVSAPDVLQATLHRQLIGQAIANLIENALKYAAGGSAITLLAQREESDLLIAVCDNGAGIPQDRRAEALRRFGRLDPARHTSGAGLGLALVEAVARLHGGKFSLGDNGPGLRAVVRFPLR